MCDINFKIDTPERDLFGPTTTTDGNYVLWEGATGGSVKVGGQPTTLDAETGNLTGVSGIELDAPNGYAITIVPPVSPASSHVLTLPPTIGNANTVLTNDGTGDLHWSTPAGAGDIIGPSGGATNNAIPLFDGASGNLVKNSTIISNTANDLHVQSTTASTNTTTGSGKFGGGIGVAGDVHAHTVKATTVVSGTSLKVINGSEVTLNRIAGGSPYSLSLPNEQGGGNTFLTNDGNGVLEFVNLPMQNAMLLYKTFPLSNVYNTNAFTDNQILGSNIMYKGTPAHGFTLQLPSSLGLVIGAFVLIKLDADLPHGHSFSVHTTDTFFEETPLFLYTTTVTQDPTTKLVTDIRTIEEQISPNANISTISLTGNSDGCCAVGSYLLFIWSGDGHGQWYATGSIRSRGRGTTSLASNIVWS